MCYIMLVPQLRRVRNRNKMPFIWVKEKKNLVSMHDNYKAYHKGPIREKTFWIS